MSFRVGREERDQNGTSREKSSSSAISIHKNVVALLNSKTPSTDDDPNKTIKRRLHDLQKHRIHLEAEIASSRSQAALTTQNLSIPCSEEDGFKYASKMTPKDLQQIRKKRKLTAAYRLGGITAAIPNVDPELLSFRFDICLEGVYVATYHAFFDLIVAQDKQMYLRLTQHTIPSAIPILELCEPRGSFVLLGENEEVDWNTDRVQQYLKEWSRRCYRACLCWHRRKHAWHALQKYKKTKTLDTSTIRVESIETPTSDAYHQISFRLYQPNWCFEITLTYGDWKKIFPHTVELVAKHATSTGHDMNEEHLVQRIKEAFSNHSVDEALERLSKGIDSQSVY